MAPAIQKTMGLAEWAMLLALGMIWGGSFYFFAIAIGELPTFVVVFLRVSIAALALWIIVWLAGLKAPSTMAAWRDFLIMGLLNNAIPFSLIVWGQHQVASGLAAIINATTPFFTVLVANVFTHDEKLSWNRLLGSVIGLAGVAVMMGVDAIRGLGSALPAQLEIVLASLFYAFGSVFGRRFTHSPLVTAAGQTTGSTLILLPLVLIIDTPWRLNLPHFSVIFAILGLALLCTSLAYVLYFTILKRAGAINLVLVTFLVPASAIFLGVVLLGEHLALQHVLGLIAIGLGLALIDGRLMRRAQSAWRAHARFKF
jgi:drug/metabolite transporter (DMT)-like permease